MIKIADCGWKATVGHVHDCVITAGQLSVSLGTYVSAHALKTSIYVTDLLNIAADLCLFAMFKTVSTVLSYITVTRTVTMFLGLIISTNPVFVTKYQ